VETVGVIQELDMKDCFVRNSVSEQYAIDNNGPGVGSIGIHGWSRIPRNGSHSSHRNCEDHSFVKVVADCFEDLVDDVYWNKKSL